MDQNIILAVIVGFTQIVKAFEVPQRFLPFVAILTGIVLMFASNAGITGELAIQGIVLGLMGIGLYSTTTVGLLGKGFSEKIGLSRKSS
jgi:uncharacterized membrane protein YfbV (UPF0208 family)